MTLHEACERIGIQCREVHADGRFHPVPVIGKPATNTSGRIKLFADNTGGFLQNHVSGEKLLFWYDDTPATLTTEEKTQRAARLKEVEKQLSADREKCRFESMKDWERATIPPPDHPYLVAKGVKAFGIRWQEAGNKLLVPVIDMVGTLHGLQYLGPDGDKRFKTGTVKVGHFHRIKGNTGKIIICEGYATGASIHEATGYLVLVAFDAGNLLAVSTAAREKWPELPIIIAADNDQYSESNVGVTKATAAAWQIGAAVAIPVFNEVCHE